MPYPFESAQQLRMRKAFEIAAKDPDPSRSIGIEAEKIEQRIKKVRDKLDAHLDRQKPIWVGREAVKLFERHKGQLKPSLSPKMIPQTETSPAALAQQAHRNVQLRCEKRVERLESVIQRLRNDLGEPNKNMSIKPEMKL